MMTPLNSRTQNTPPSQPLEAKVWKLNMGTGLPQVEATHGIQVLIMQAQQTQREEMIPVWTVHSLISLPAYSVGGPLMFTYFIEVSSSNSRKNILTVFK